MTNPNSVTKASNPPSSLAYGAQQVPQLSPKSSARSTFALFLLALGIGSALRGWQWLSQIVADDEWHAIHKLMHASYQQIASTFGFADHSIPLTLYFKLMADTVGLNELSMRLPFLLAGLALIGWACVGFKAILKPHERALLALQIAISPLLILYSRVARPYAITVLCCTVAIWAIWQWRQTGKHAYAALYIPLAVLSGYAHSVTLAFVLTPLLFFGLKALLLENPKERWRRLFEIGSIICAVLLILGALLAPAIFNDLKSLTAKGGLDHVTLSSGFRSVLLLTGSKYPVALALWFGFFLIGYRTLCARHPEFAQYLVFVCVVYVLAVLLTGAAMISYPLVGARYLLVALPVLLIFVTLGIATSLQKIVSRRWWILAALMLVAVQFWRGPMLDFLYKPNQLMSHSRFQFDVNPRVNSFVNDVSNIKINSFYASLAKQPAKSLTIVEAPWRFEFPYNEFDVYQAVLRQTMRVGFLTSYCRDVPFGEYPKGVQGMAFKQFVHLADVVNSGSTYGDYLVFHKNPIFWPPEDLNRDFSACEIKLKKDLGKPVHEDEQLLVFDLRLLQFAKTESVLGAATGNPDAQVQGKK